MTTRTASGAGDDSAGVPAAQDRAVTGGDLAAEALSAALDDQWKRALAAVQGICDRDGGRGACVFMCSLGDVVTAVLPPGARELGPLPGQPDAGQEWAARFLAGYLHRGYSALRFVEEIPPGRGIVYAGAVLAVAAAVVSRQVEAGWEPPPNF